MTHGTILIFISAFWVGSELVLGVARRARTKGSSPRDRGSLIVLWVLIGGSTFLGANLNRVRPALMPHRSAMFWLGIALIVVGIIIRWTAILTLRQYFTVNVTIQEAHELVDRGIYGVVRHPSYSGSILSFLGLGFAFGNWISLAVIAVATFLGFAYRIHVEEAALTEHFGDRYREYAKRTKRLVPGIY